MLTIPVFLSGISRRTMQIALEVPCQLKPASQRVQMFLVLVHSDHCGNVHPHFSPHHSLCSHLGNQTQSLCPTAHLRIQYTELILHLHIQMIQGSCAIWAKIAQVCTNQKQKHRENLGLGYLGCCAYANMLSNICKWRIKYLITNSTSHLNKCARRQLNPFLAHFFPPQVIDFFSWYLDDVSICSPIQPNCSRDSLSKFASIKLSLCRGAVRYPSGQGFGCKADSWEFKSQLGPPFSSCSVRT